MGIVDSSRKGLLILLPTDNRDPYKLRIEVGLRNPFHIRSSNGPDPRSEILLKPAAVNRPRILQNAAAACLHAQFVFTDRIGDRLPQFIGSDAVIAKTLDFLFQRLLDLRLILRRERTIGIDR